MNKYLVCVDSDGAAMDTMTIKHVRCFGPDIISEWGLKDWEEELLKRWNDINLYTKDRGINRFQGLYKFLSEVDENKKKLPGINALKEWVGNTKAFSEGALSEAIESFSGEEDGKNMLKQALSWSKAVNIHINELNDDEKIPFEGVKEALAAVKEHADLAIVSSANREAMEEEWVRCGLMEYVDYSMAQDAGSKADCIALLKSKGYSEKNILMVGDAQGDYRAAKRENVLFYPILAGRETESWQEFKDIYLPLFLGDGYDEHKEAERLKVFNEVLP